MLLKAKEDHKIKKWHFFAIGFIILFSFALKAYYAYIPKAEILINGKIVQVLLADNYSRMYKGLSDKTDLGEYDGMLFIYPQASRLTVVMRDMNFSLDIIWIRNNSVVEIIRDIKPEPNTAESALKKYYSIYDADMVLEVESGYVDKNNIKVGDSIILMSE